MMKIHLAVYRAESGDHNRYKSFVSDVKKYGGVDDWSATRKFSIGDLILFYFGDPMMSIAAIGIVASELHTYKGRRDWTNRKETTFCDFAPIWLLKPVLLKETSYRIGLQNWYSTRPYRNSRELAPKVAQKLLAEITSNNPNIQRRISKLGIEISEMTKQSDRRKKVFRRPSLEYSEGGVREITIELQRRNPNLRKQAIAIYGESCRVCRFNFGDFYGALEQFTLICSPPL
jgi:hypothetical protein